jgi:hypothetical protein
MNPHSPKWIPALGVGVSMDSRIFRESLQGQTHYIKDFLIPLYSSWKLDIWNGLAWSIWTPKTQVMAKRRVRESNWQFNFRPLEVGNRLYFLAWRCHATYYWKVLDKGYNFASNFISVGGLHTKLWAPKVGKVPIVGISRLPLGSPRTKWHLGVGPLARHRVYYKGEGGSFPQVQVVVIL